MVRHTLAVATAVALFVLPGTSSPAAAAVILDADFDAGASGFSYVDDPFLGTSQPSYASGAWQNAGGFGNTGGLTVSLGGIDGSTIVGMSGGWSTTFELAVAATGVQLRYRYSLSQSATYEFSEYSRSLVSLDGELLGRGAKAYVDHVGGDGSSSQGNSSTYLPTTDWQEHVVHVGDLAAGTHTLIIGGFNNGKNAADETTTVRIDDVLMVDGQPASEPTVAELLGALVDVDVYTQNIEDLADFGDRCRMSSCPGSPANSYLDAQAWVADELEAMGYTLQYHNTTYIGSSITNLYATKVGTEHPDQMYIVSAHLDGRGGGGGADDDASGVSLVMEAARILALPDVETETSVRFIFWDREEAGLIGSSAYAAERASLQGVQSPSGSGLYPEPTWLGILQHDMVLYDHGAGSPGSDQSVYADMDVEWRAGTAEEADSRALAMIWHNRSGLHSALYPSTAYNFSTNTDDTPFHGLAPSISIRENRRSLTSGGNAEWINPYYHQTTDVFDSYDEADFTLGSEIARVTLGTVAELAGAYLVGHPTAVPQVVITAKDTAVPVHLTGSDPDDEPLTFALETMPAHGAVSGIPPNVVYTPDAGYFGVDAFTFTASDGLVSSEPATVDVTIAAARHELPFVDTFDEDKGWVVDFFGTDTAGGGTWERGDPEPTSSDGPKQLGVAAGEPMALVTGLFAGLVANSHDVDGGETSVMSPALALPTGSDIELSMAFYLAHGRNASADDRFRVRVLGGGQADQTVIEERGAPENDDGAWETAIVRLGAFAGQTVTLQIDVADGGRASLVEAAVDDVSVITTTVAPLLAADFDSGADGFAYEDDAFRTTSEPAYASGEHIATGGRDGGGLRVTLGGVDDAVVAGMSGGWQHDFTLVSPSSVVVSFWFRLTQSSEYEQEELSEALVSVDDALMGLSGQDAIARIFGNGNGGIDETTGWRPVSVVVGPLAAGEHSLVIGGYNSAKGFSNEWTEILIDDVEVRVR